MIRNPLHPTVVLYTARALRDFGDGFVAVLLPVYLIALGFTPFQVGLIATAAMFGSALMTLAIGILGARYDHRQLLLAAASVMIATGVAYAAVHDYALLLVVAFAGTINPSGGSVSVFVPLEHAVLAREVADRDRTKAFARYSLVGAMAGAGGALSSAVPDFLAPLGLDRFAGIKMMFIAYALLGVVGALVYSRIPSQPLTHEQRTGAVLGPSRSVVYKLAVLFSLDSFASGFTVNSLLALWLFERFQLSLSTASLFFFWSGVFTAFSFPVAAWLSRYIGLVRTMVYTHVPASLCLIAAAFAPTLAVVFVLLLIRAALSQMDVPARSSYVMAVVTPPERAAAASFTTVPRSIASAASPVLAGALYAASTRGWPLLICGTLKIIYDLLLLIQFRHVKPPEER